VKVSYHNPRSVIVNTGNPVSRIALAIAIATVSAAVSFTVRNAGLITDMLYGVLAVLGIASGAGIVTLVHYLRHPVDAIRVARPSAIWPVSFPATITVRRDAAIPGTLRSISQAAAADADPLAVIAPRQEVR
jgi:hypothetical protein